MPPLRIERLGRVPYEPTWRAMQRYTVDRNANTEDALWLLEHPPIFTQGQAGRPEHVLTHTDIPIVPIDRGGQITYHGPGQVVIYLLIDLRRRGYGVRELVQRMEQAVIDFLAAHGITGERRVGAPGVYVGEAKIAALGLRVKNGCTYHGMALNVDMDLAPFAAINPCGYPGLRVTQLRDLGVNLSVEVAGEALLAALLGALRVGEILKDRCNIGLPTIDQGE